MCTSKECFFHVLIYVQNFRNLEAILKKVWGTYSPIEKYSKMFFFIIPIEKKYMSKMCLLTRLTYVYNFFRFQDRII